MSAAVWLGAWLALPLLGAPLLAHPAYRRFSLICRAVLSGAVAAVVFSLVQTLFALAGLSWSLVPLALLSAATCAVLRRLAGTAGDALPDAGDGGGGEPGRRLAVLLSAAAIGIALLATVAGAAASSDLLLFWGPKAEAFAAARTIDAGFLSSARAAPMHPYYPPLVTNLYAAATMAAGAFSWRAAILTFPMLLAALSLALPSILRFADRPLAPAAVSALVVSALALLGAEVDVAGNADTILLLFETLGLALLLQPRPLGAPMLLLAGLLLAGAATTKVEGLPFALAVVLLFLPADRGHGDLKAKLARLAGPTAVALAAWFVFGLGRHAFSAYGEYGSLLELRWDRLGFVLAQIGRNAWHRGWGLPYLVPLAVLLLSRQTPRQFPLSVGAVLMIFLTATYMLPVPDPALWIEWSANRTFAPLIVLLSLSLRAPTDESDGGYGAPATSPS